MIMDIGKIRRMLDKSGRYADITIEESESTTITAVDGEVRPRQNKEPGVRVRVLNRGWGVASSSRIGFDDADHKDIQALSDSAERLSRVAKKDVRLADIKVRRVKSETPFRIDPLEVPIDRKVKDLKEIEKEMGIKGIKTTSAHYSDDSVRSLFISSEGAEIESRSVRCTLSAAPMAAKGALMQRAHESTGTVEGYEIFKRAGGMGELAAKRAVALLKADVPKAGRYTVILSNEVAGVMSHEAVGHTVESDIKGSVLENSFGKRVASDLVTIMDDPTLKAHGHYEYDDEGVKAERNVIIEDGMLKGFLHSRETAGERPGTGHPGNARAEDYSSIPQVRMSNTFFGKGDHSVDEVMDVKHGIYIRQNKGGETEPSVGSYVFFMEEGWIIKNGEMTTPLRDIVIKGSILKTLFNVEAVGKDLKIEGTGYCGKGGQLVPVSDGGPHIRISDVTVGGR